MIKKGIADFLFPRYCLECKKKGRFLCPSCIAEVERRRTLCPVCEKASFDGMTHHRCKTPYSLDGAITLWPYKEVIRKAILALKYRFAFEIAKELSFLAVKKIKSSYPEMARERNILIPIPTTKERKNWRGFNQTEIMGKIIAKQLNWIYRDNLLIQRKKIRPQTGLKGKTRKQNIKGVFSINPEQKKNIQNQEIIIFDDVWTTGSTIKEAAREIKKKYKNKIWGLTIART